MVEEIIYKLKVNIFKQASLYLEEIGVFAPFGAKIKNNIVQEVGYEEVDEEVETIDSKMVIGILKDHLSNQLIEKQIEGAAIAFDVAKEFKNADGILEKRDALCLTFSTNGDNWTNEYFPYMIIDKQCVWK